MKKNQGLFIKIIIPVVVKIGVYYLFILRSPEFYVSGHEIGIILSALVAEFVLINRRKRDECSSLIKTKILLTHVVVFLIEGALLEFVVGNLGLSLWIAPLINVLMGTIIHHVMEEKFVQRHS